MSIKYLVYSRKSSEDEEKQALSIESQLDKARELFSDLDIVDFLTESASAFKPDNRPVFTEMIRRIENGEAQGIISWHPDRLSRNEVDAAKITYMIRTTKILNLKFGSYSFDNSPEGIMMLQMVMSQSQYFSAKLSKDVVRGLDKKVEMGWKPGVVKTGYLNTPHRDKGTKVIAKDPDRFTIVRKMWDLLLTGAYTVPQILEIANNEWGFRTLQRKKIGGGPLARSTLYSLFTDIFYTGMFLHKGEVCKGEHDAMITLEEFDKAQLILGRKGKPRPQRHRFPYTGFMRCGECGCAITAEIKKKTYTYYHCTHKKPCSQRRVMRAEELEHQIEQQLSSITIAPQFREWALEVLNRSNDSEVEDRSKIHINQSRALLQTQQQLDNLTKMRYRDLIDDGEYISQRNELKAQIAKLKEQLRDTENRADKWLELTEKTFDFATYARHNFLHGDLNAKKEILVALGQNPTIRDGRLHIELNKWFQPIAKFNEKQKAESQLVRTGNSASAEPKDGDLSLKYNSWLSVVEEVRTITINNCFSSAAQAHISL